MSRSVQEVRAFIKDVMLPKGATESEVDEYASSEGYTFEQIKAAAPAKQEVSFGEALMGKGTPKVGTREEALFGGVTPESARGVSETVTSLVENAPQTIGGILGGIGAVVSGVGLPAAALMAFTGGAGGKGWQNTYYELFEPEKAPDGSLEAIASAIDAGAEEAAYELGGRVVAGVAGKAYHIMRPKIAGGVKELQKSFSKYGGKFTLAQSTDSYLVEATDSLTRGSLSGKGVMLAADDFNDIALKKWQDDLSSTIAKDASKSMDRTRFGDLIKNTLSDGKIAFKASMKEIYGNFDQLVKTQIKKEMLAKKIPSTMVDDAGVPLQKTIVEEVSKEIRPVDTRPLKEQASNILSQLARVKDIGLGDFGGKTLKQVLELDDALRFQDAQTLRSTLLDIGRKVADDPAEAKLAGSIHKLADSITKSMDTAAMKQGKDTFKAYQKIKKQAELGYTSFNDKFIANILKDDTASKKVTENIFREGNVDEVHKLRKALLRSKQYDPALDTAKVWRQTQQNYLETVLGSATRDIPIEAGEGLAAHQKKAGVIDAIKLRAFFQQPKKVETMDVMLSPSHRKALFEFAEAASLTQAKSRAGLGMLVQLAQGGTFIQAVTGKPGAIKQAAGLFLGMETMAKIMTSRAGVKILTSGLTTPVAAKQAPIITTKLLAAIKAAEGEAEEGERPFKGLIKSGLEAL